jgi:hypothetical protein
MTATHEQNSTIPTTPVLYFSLELGRKRASRGTDRFFKGLRGVRHYVRT